MSLDRVFAEINLNNLKQNITYLKKVHKIYKSSFFCPMVKANAYGHGDILISKCIENEVSHFGVVFLEEGIRLRESGIVKPILVFGYFSSDECVNKCSKWNLTPVISSFEFLDLFIKNKWNKSVHIKFDTGMTRLGFQIHQVEKLKSILDSNKIKVEGVATHFLNGEDFSESNGYSQKQLEEFLKIKKLFTNSSYFHCLNSSALLSEKKDISKIIGLGARPGISIYGYHPFLKSDSHLKPVMTLKSRLVQIKNIPKNTVVSYGATWKSSEDSIIGIVSIGYADGFHRSFSNNYKMYLNKSDVPLVGRVCMDYCMVDLTHHKNLKNINIGDEITVWGENTHNLNLIADHVGTISYELLTQVGPRVPRRIVNA